MFSRNIKDETIPWKLAKATGGMIHRRSALFATLSTNITTRQICLQKAKTGRLKLLAPPYPLSPK